MPEPERKELVRSLAVRDFERAHQGSALIDQLERLAERPKATVTALLHEARSFWTSDAIAALEALKVQNLSAKLAALAASAWAAIFAVSQVRDSLSFGASWYGALLDIPYHPLFACALLAFSGAVLSLLVDETYAPAAEHWQLVRNKRRTTSSVSAFLIGIVIYSLWSWLGPAVFGVGTAIEESSAGPESLVVAANELAEAARGVEAASLRDSADGVTAAVTDLDGTDDSPSAPPRDYRLYALAFLAGFSQTWFMGRLDGLRQ